MEEWSEVVIWVGGVEGCGDRDGELEVKSKKIGRITDNRFC